MKPINVCDAISHKCEINGSYVNDESNNNCNPHSILTQTNWYHTLKLSPLNISAIINLVYDMKTWLGDQVQNDIFHKISLQVLK